MLAIPSTVSTRTVNPHEVAKDLSDVKDLVEKGDLNAAEEAAAAKPCEIERAEAFQLIFDAYRSKGDLEGAKSVVSHLWFSEQYPAGLALFQDYLNLGDTASAKDIASRMYPSPSMEQALQMEIAAKKYPDAIVTVKHFAPYNEDAIRIVANALKDETNLDARELKKIESKANGLYKIFRMLILKALIPLYQSLNMTEDVARLERIIEKNTHDYEDTYPRVEAIENILHSFLIGSSASAGVLLLADHPDLFVDVSNPELFAGVLGLGLSKLPFFRRVSNLAGIAAGSLAYHLGCTALQSTGMGLSIAIGARSPLVRKAAYFAADSVAVTVTDTASAAAKAAIGIGNAALWTGQKCVKGLIETARLSVNVLESSTSALDRVFALAERI